MKRSHVGGSNGLNLGDFLALCHFCIHAQCCVSHVQVSTVTIAPCSLNNRSCAFDIMLSTGIDLLTPQEKHDAEPVTLSCSLAFGFLPICSLVVAPLMLVSARWSYCSSKFNAFQQFTHLLFLQKSKLSSIASVCLSLVSPRKRQ